MAGFNSPGDKIGTRIALPFLVLLCDLKCPQCVNHHTEKAKLNYPLVSGMQWIEAINALELVEQMKTPGGEPTPHPDFVGIFNNIRDLPGRILIGTNG